MIWVKNRNRRQNTPESHSARLPLTSNTIDLQRCFVLLGGEKAATRHQPGLLMEEQQ